MSFALNLSRKNVFFGLTVICRIRFKINLVQFNVFLEDEELKKLNQVPCEEPSEFNVSEYSKQILRSFPVEGSSRYFSRKTHSLPRFMSEDGKPLTLQSPKRSFTSKQWSEKSETMLKELVIEECKQLINVGSIPLNQSGKVQAYRAETTPSERTHCLQVLMPNLINSFSWEVIASKVGHSQTDCFVHWMNCCDPFVNQNPWTLEEDKKLVLAAERRKKRCWVKIASELGNGRSSYPMLSTLYS